MGNGGRTKGRLGGKIGKVRAAAFRGTPSLPHTPEGRLAARRAIRESEEKFRILFEKSSDPTLILDGDTFADCNEAALTFMKCGRKDQIIGLRPPISPLKGSPTAASLPKRRASMWISHHAEDRDRFEWVHRDFRGREVSVDVSLTVIPIAPQEGT